MKKAILCLPVLFCIGTANAQSKLLHAQEQAKESHKFILLNFSGSDWCIPCIQMEKEIFENASFHQYAQEHLVVVNADFPRSKKVQPTKEIIKENEALAEQYNTNGTFPLTLLLDPNGKVLKEWPGNPHVSAEQFVQQVQAVINANH